MRSLGVRGDSATDGAVRKGGLHTDGLDTLRKGSEKGLLVKAMNIRDAHDSNRLESVQKSTRIEAGNHFFVGDSWWRNDCRRRAHAQQHDSSEGEEAHD